MDEKDLLNQEPTAIETRSEFVADDVEVTPLADIVEHGEPQPQYDYFMRVIRR